MESKKVKHGKGMLLIALALILNTDGFQRTVLSKVRNIEQLRPGDVFRELDDLGYSWSEDKGIWVKTHEMKPPDPFFD